MSAQALAWTMLGGVLLDAALGEPRRAHPLVAFGRLARALETALHADSRARGLAAWTLATLPLSAAAGWLHCALWQWSAWAGGAFAALALYFAIGLRSLREHAVPVAEALDAGRLEDARAAVGRIVSRDAHALDAERVAAAATESVLENGSDAVFAALFWFALLGPAGAVLYRLSNTLDAMWGYRSERYERFGWAAARIDDALNWVPARLTALTYAALGDGARALRCWRAQAPRWDSPNAGPVMAAGAGALGVRLGGDAPYRGVWESRPQLGEGATPDAGSIRRALALVERGTALWLLAVAVAAFALAGWRHA
ncbi:adenosylcobinamide-phosphate synthase CbiB [Lysobacter enzymogenes]|uniref:adenosylcobinamide-phosphate synthase CbiB n=1 Tax=Lysobacter enzymogenes TaxID=69 RepID=UPI001AF84CB0|nr:adenosylcobinamide-phosphate synthase CbiB [Lysobacter enzymogenes]QQQ02477.1 cobalamin biosynthesis protein [Lysobacter enzymogenes]